MRQLSVQQAFRSAIALVLMLAAISCGDDRVYVGDDKLYQIAITKTTAPVFQGRDSALYMVETRLSLPVRKPTQADLRDLQSGVHNYPKLPFPRLPWVERGDLETTVDFTLENLDTAAHDVDVTVNVANEFDEYFPGIQIVEEDATPLHANWERRYSVPAKSRVSRTVREEDLDEAAVDLATVVNGAPNSDEVVYFENKSVSDPRSMKYIPAVIPGLVALRLGLRTLVALRLGLRTTEAPPILLEATVRVRDAGGKLAAAGEPVMQTHPKTFRPILPP